MPIERALAYLHKAMFENDIKNWTVEPGSYNANTQAAPAPPLEQAAALKEQMEDESDDGLL